MPSLPYDPILHHDLQNPKFAAGYLSECLADPNPLVFLLAVKKVMAARGVSQSQVAKFSGLHPVTLSRMLSDKGNPELRNILSILRSMDLDFQIKPRTKRSVQSKKSQPA